MKRVSVSCVRWLPTLLPVIVGVWFLILICIVYRTNFSHRHISLQKRISETYIFDIEYDSTKHTENTIFHVEPWNYDYDSDDETFTTPLPQSAVSTPSSPSTSNKITTQPSPEISSTMPVRKLVQTTNSPGRTFKKMVTSDLFYSKFADEFDHDKPHDIMDLLPDRTNILDISTPGKEFRKYNAGRIVHQLNHMSSEYNSTNVKVIYLSGNKGYWHHTPGMSAFEQCHINACTITYDAKQGPNADALVFSNPGQLPRKPPFRRKSPKQIWVISMIESPMNTKMLKNYNGLFNWTMTYRTNSVIETPYFKYQKYKNSFIKPNAEINYAKGKTKKVAWMVSNCIMSRSGRISYAKNLAKHIEVDIYGACGTKSCPKKEDKKCLHMLETDYKFYLAFENTKCLDYVTEKAVKALENKVIPVVLGASKATYQSILPTGSFIHVEDFRSPEELAQHLHRLDKNDTMYNEYFRWREQGEFIETKPWCRLCGLLHEPLLPPVWYDNIENWWRPKNVCIDKSDWTDKKAS
ncbi:glycoprotein 3-alpha-L-fucosyltransferase A-like [Pecten maximus]|uniref:glycoprotein 3-alpha-L-fucosyltransferase A-like n=1 Tax=Pecten maximus TaxID=6579 RepID=UPI001458F039|nr:glycoprotein 3-alpha-L-fucosyltransferase A-like [Pecten maximus]